MHRKVKTHTPAILAGMLLVFSSCLGVQQVSAQDAVPDSDPMPRVAARGTLPVAVHVALRNASSSVDAHIVYAMVTMNDRVLAHEEEEVRVIGTKDIVHSFTVPAVDSGEYMMRVLVVPRGQTASNVTAFPFIVERTIAGVFVSDLMHLGTVMLGVLIFLMLTVWVLERARQRRG